MTTWSAVMLCSCVPRLRRRRPGSAGPPTRPQPREERLPVDVAQRLAGEDQHEGDALQQQHRRIGQAQPALQQAAGRAEAAEQDGHRDDRQRMMARDERNQDAGVAVARDQRGVGAGVHGRHLDRAGQAGGRAAERAGHQDQPRGRQAHQLRRAQIAADHAHREARRRQRAARRRAARQATTPITRPQCTSEPAMPPMRRPSASA